tara:strand:+ start:1204 stop:2232 length:1029 start_codon:yes stop_codon:yes gene_type:complete
MSLKNLSAKNRILSLFKNKLNNKKVNQIYKQFEKSIKDKDKFIVAVSGGPDSLALAFLAKVYSIKNNILCKFFIIDHKIRPESTKEARYVKNLLKKNFITAKILTWKQKKPSTNIQSLARKKRYELLFNACDKLKIKNILLGHHQDDLFENFFIRLLRGSGLKGLTSLGLENKIGDKNLIRPLIHQNKKDLMFISKHVFNFYVEDPTNKDEKFQRIRVRKLITELQKNGLDKKKFSNTIKNLKYSDNVVNFYVNENLFKNAFFSKKDNKLILNNKFFKQPYEVTFRSFSEAIKLVGKRYHFVRGKKLEKMISNIDNGGILKATLGGCIIEKVKQTVIISKER